jgi:hypothetical protein
VSETKYAAYGVDDWMKGDRGTAHPSNTDKAKMVNVRVYRDGSLGPRPRWEFDGSTNTGTGVNARIWPARYRYGGGFSPGVSGFVVVGVGVLDFYEWGNTVDRPYAEYTGLDSPAASLESQHTRIDETRWVIGGQLIDLAGPSPATPKTIALTEISATIDPAFAGSDNVYIRGAAQHQGRTFYWGSIFSGTSYSARNRLWYSDPYAPVTFSSATQYIDFDGGTIEGALSLGANLFVWTSAAEWFVIQGRGNPADATVNAIGPGRRPLLGRPPARLDNTALFFSSDLLALIVLTEDGSMDEVVLGHLGARTATPSFEVLSAVTWLAPAADGEINAVILTMEGANARSMHNGVWTTEDWNIAQDSTFPNSEQVGVCPQGNAEMLATYRHPSGGTWDVYIRESVIDKPQLAGSGSDETFVCTLGLPRMIEPNSNLRVRSVTIDCRTWSATNPLPSLAVSVADGNNATTAFTTGPNSSSLASVGEGEQSHQFIFTSAPLPFSQFSDITITFNGLVIENVLVEFETNMEPLV